MLFQQMQMSADCIDRCLLPRTCVGRVSVPQTNGGFVEGLAPWTEKESAWQLVACVEPKYSTVLDPCTCPYRLFNSRVILVLGPVMTKVVKSSRIEQMSSFIGQTVSEHEPADTVVGCVQ